MTIATPSQQRAERITVQIKHRFNGAVLFEYEATDERVASGLALRDAMECAVAARANLAGANLARANLARQHMQIGCELHSLADWAAFDDTRIVQMDGKNALRFWRAHKDVLLALAASDGRGVAVAQAEAA